MSLNEKHLRAEGFTEKEIDNIVAGHKLDLHRERANKGDSGLEQKGIHTKAVIPQKVVSPVATPKREVTKQPRKKPVKNPRKAGKTKKSPESVSISPEMKKLAKLLLQQVEQLQRMLTRILQPSKAKTAKTGKKPQARR